MAVVSKVELYGQNNDGNPISYVIASSATIAKGDFLKFSDDGTVAFGSDLTTPTAGVAIMQKTADFSTRISVWTYGKFKCLASGAIALGSPIRADGANTVSSCALMASGAASGAQVIGYSIGAYSNGDTCEWMLRL